MHNHIPTPPAHSPPKSTEEDAAGPVLYAALLKEMQQHPEAKCLFEQLHAHLEET